MAMCDRTMIPIPYFTTYTVLQFGGTMGMPSLRRMGLKSGFGAVSGSLSVSL